MRACCYIIPAARYRFIQHRRIYYFGSVYIMYYELTFALRFSTRMQYERGTAWRILVYVNALW
jgi:hypothetical protein